MPSRAFRLFNGKKKQEIIEIAQVFQSINTGRGPNTNYSLLNGALVLLVSSWEVYCEDVCRQTTEIIQNRPTLRFEQLDEKLKKNIIRYAGSQYTGRQDPLEEKLAMLPDGGWRQLLADRLDEYLPDFNTPKFRRTRGKDLNDLFQKVLGIKVSGRIENFLQHNGLCDQLDAVVSLRGKIAHTGDAPPEFRLSPETLERYTTSFVEAAAALDVIVYKEFKKKLGFAPWQITQSIRQALRQDARGRI